MGARNTLFEAAPIVGAGEREITQMGEQMTEAEKDALKKIEQQFSEWLCREMPAGTIIGDPKWWAPKIVRAVLRGLESAEPVAWREWVEERLLSWRRVMNTDGDQLALDDFMDQESFHDLIDFVCSEYEGPAALPAASGTVQVPKEGK